MRSVVVIIVNIVFYQILQLTASENNKMVQTFPADRTDEPFRIGIHVRRIGDNAYVLEIVLTVGKPPQFSRIVMDKG